MVASKRHLLANRSSVSLGKLWLRVKCLIQCGQGLSYGSVSFYLAGHTPCAVIKPTSSVNQSVILETQKCPNTNLYFYEIQAVALTDGQIT